MLKIGHRGADAYEPENTLKSFKRAFELGANCVEFDVRMTKDGKLILMHDKTVDRTTNGHGLVNEMIFKDIRKLEIDGEKVPTLKEALSVVKEYKGKCLVEIKDKKATKKILREIPKDMKDDVVIISFYTDALKEAKSSGFKTGLITTRKIKNLLGFFKLCKFLKVDWVLPEVNTINKEFVEKAHKWGLKVIVWIINTKKELNKWKNLVDGIATDKPDIFSTYNIH